MHLNAVMRHDFKNEFIDMASMQAQSMWECSLLYRVHHAMT